MGRRYRANGMAILLSGALLIADVGRSGATPILPNGGGEPSLATTGGILDTLYGLENLTRMDDAVDQLWGNTGLAHVLVVAKYSAYPQLFGYLTGANGGA